jgi:lipopolysaccharide/colanic/teichoic acid biosynthesis glycosyltransferase
MVKFRTMIPVTEVTPAMFASSGDPRITRVGAWLRRFRLDELPQFWNVLRGDMSVVGPRPEQREFVTQFSTTIPLYDIRLQVRPGITGWAQVTHGYADSEGQTREKLRRDLYYIKHLSPATDVRILLKTTATILTGFGSR